MVLCTKRLVRSKEFGCSRAVCRAPDVGCGLESVRRSLRIRGVQCGASRLVGRVLGE